MNERNISQMERNSDSLEHATAMSTSLVGLLASLQTYELAA